MITVAKAAGNGFPFGAVLARVDIAEAFSRSGSFFSSAGGSYASCVAASCVLDVIAEEGLQRNALEVGEGLKARLLELAGRYPIVGAVHGMGLYLGVELVRGRGAGAAAGAEAPLLEPAREEAYALCERLLELGVLTQPTSDRSNVLKVKPPMCMGKAAADHFVEALERALRDGW